MNALTAGSKPRREGNTAWNDEARQHWELHGADGAVRCVKLSPRVMGLDYPMLMALAHGGAGIAALPEALCEPAVRGGDLEVVLPRWRLPTRTSRTLSVL